MNDTHKPLRAFIEASGFDVETAQDRKEHYLSRDIIDETGKPKLGALPTSITMNTSYKVTKKEQPPMTMLEANEFLRSHGKAK